MSDFEIQLIRHNNTGLRRLTRSVAPNTDAQWTPDGTRVSFTRAPNFDWTKAWIWTVGRDGTNLLRVARGQFGRWSPDGRRLVLDAPTASSHGDIFIVDADGGHRRLLLASPELDQPADWSPDGKTILFTRFEVSGHGSSVWVVGIDGAGARRRAAGVAGSWSPDGSHIVYTRGSPGRVYVMRADGTGKRPVGKVVGADADWR